MRRVLLYGWELTVLVAGAAFLTNMAAAQDSAGPGPAGAAQVLEIARKANICLEISLSAVENAMATQDQAEAGLMGAMKAANKPLIDEAEEKLELASDEAEEARELAKKIMDYAAEANAAASDADQEARRATPTMTERERSASAKKLDHLLDVARTALKKADALAQTLKKKWLLPVIPAASAATTTVQPPAPGPVAPR